MIASMERVAQTSVPRADAGERLIDFLVRRFTYLPYGDWVRAIGDGAISVNGDRSEPDRRIAEGDLIRFSPEALEEPETDERFSVRYEDDELLIADKPPNLPVHPSGRFFKRTLWYLLRQTVPTPRFATRLDRETSGLVLVAKTAEEARRLQSIQLRGEMDKRYLALVHGRFVRPTAARGWLIPDEASAVRKKRAFVAGDDPRRADASERGEVCETLFEPAGTTGDFSLARARLGTGRTHQIRATLYAMDFPIVGDKLYGLDETAFIRFAAGTLTDQDRARLILPYQALRCERLAFPSRGGRTIDVSADPPEWSAQITGAGCPAPAAPR
jgi:23S rRNA pseudouridine955/2504/2580 synthase/23S rRNA pseudouridine1911/1915/1917 synthase